MRLLAAAGSDPGLERDNNEDRILCEPDKGIYAVIDGVGGESGGEIAAQTALDILKARLSRRTTDAARLVREAIALANKQIFEQAQANPALANMACVLTVAVVDGNRATIGHVGDSRLYLLRRGEIRKVTRDHSPVGAREDAREISEEEAMRHPRRNEIFRDVGSAPHEPDEEGFIDVTQIAFEPDAALVLCSDGLSDLVTSQDILRTVEGLADDPHGAVMELIAQANAAGGKDNISVVLVEGERFAQSVRALRAGPTEELATTATRVPIRGAGVARSAGPGKLLGAFVSRPAFLLYGLILGAVSFAAFGQGLLARFLPPAGDDGLPVASRDVLRVGVGDGGLATITEALAKAGPGQTVLVGPGQYREALQLRAGVRLVSEVPRGAVILPPLGSGVPAVTAQGVSGARLEGFRIAGDEQAPLQVGLRLADSSVQVESVEISGAQTAAVDFAGTDRSAVRYSFLHDNPGGGALVEGTARPTLLHNLLLRNGKAAGAPARPGVEVQGEGQPVMIGNRFEDNGGGGVLLSSPDRQDEILYWNTFGALGRTPAVHAPAPPPAAAPPAAPRRRGR